MYNEREKEGAEVRAGGTAGPRLQDGIARQLTGQSKGRWL